MIKNLKICEKNTIMPCDQRTYSSFKLSDIAQPEDGYRHSIDPILLAGMTPLETDDRIILDFGTGCGIIPILLANRYPDRKFFGIEIQEELYGFAEKNVISSGFSKQITLLHRDINSLSGTDIPQADLILSNPPYKAIGSGRVCPGNSRAIARHEIAITLDSLVSNASKRLKPQGRFAVIFPAQRLTELICTLRTHNLEPRQMRMIHPLAGKDAKLVMIWATKGGGQGLKILAPLFLYDSPNAQSAEVTACLASNSYNCLKES